MGNACRGDTRGAAKKKMGDHLWRGGGYLLRKPLVARVVQALVGPYGENSNGGKTSYHVRILGGKEIRAAGGAQREGAQ